MVEKKIIFYRVLRALSTKLLTQGEKSKADWKSKVLMAFKCILTTIDELELDKKLNYTRVFIDPKSELQYTVFNNAFVPKEDSKNEAQNEEVKSVKNTLLDLADQFTRAIFDTPSFFKAIK